MGRYRNPATVLFWDDGLPPGSAAEPVALPTDDRSATTATLYTPGSAASTAVCLMHPRVDFTHHYLVPLLLERGIAVLAQRSRFVNNDIGLVHERVLLDVAAASASSGPGASTTSCSSATPAAPASCVYAAQAARPAADRLADDPAGTPIDLTGDLPAPSGLILLAPHSGQGDLLAHGIDPAVIDEDDPGSTDPALDLYDPANGFAPPPESSHYDSGFVDSYRQAQADRVARIDARARGLLAAGGRAARYVVVHRTDADPRAVDLSIDPSPRDYGSIFGVRPDVINRGAVGFGRISTPEAWLSTWSAHATRAAIRHTAPGIELPVLVVGYSADNTVYPADLAAIAGAFSAAPVTRADVEGDHYGLAPDHRSRPGGKLAADVMTDWLARR